jgi:predicted nucleic acid-binding protein
LSRAGTLTAKRAALALDTLAELRITRYDHTLILKRVWALRETLSAYDACYVALAEQLDARLITFDARLASAKHRATVVQPERA